MFFEMQVCRRLISLIIFLPFVLVTQMSLAQEPGQNEPVTLPDGWMYRKGDSPLDSTGKFAWFDESITQPAWITSAAQNTPSEVLDNFIWIKYTLPEIIWDQPALLLQQVITKIEVYIDGERIYANGELEYEYSNKFDELLFHIVPLGIDYGGKTMYVRLFSSNAARIGLTEVPVIGNQSDIYALVIKNNIESYILGFIFIFFGLFSMVIYLRRKETKPYFILTFGVFTFSAGLSNAILNPINQLILNYIGIIYFVGHVSFTVFPVGMWAFYEQIAGSGYKKMIRRFWQFNIIVLSVFLFLDITNLYTYHESQGIFLIFLGAEIAAASAQFLFGHMITHKTDIAVKLFHVGFAVLALFGSINILTAFGVIPLSHELFPWGLLIFVIILAFVIELKFTENHRNLEKYSGELEIKSKELEKSYETLEGYSKTLEEKVEDRTKDLKEKNIDLENTMRDLHNAQQKIAMQEKMASLGNLVAGVAHEINNPIGAVNSAADVSERAVDKLEKAINAVGLNLPADALESTKKAMKIIRDNVRLTAQAGERIAKIVKNLKNFARLDEADIQKTDIHEGIESTIALLQHQFKNRIKVETKFGELPEIICYPNELNQAFMNILVNAAQAIEGEGTIKVTTTENDDTVTITIADTGIGIPEEHLKKIFDPGFTLKGVGVGTGLGLSITYNIIKKHEGDIEVKSEVGKGTEFIITLPVKKK